VFLCMCKCPPLQISHLLANLFTHLGRASHWRWYEQRAVWSNEKRT
jgi:hypothetical protein